MNNTIQGIQDAPKPSGHSAPYMLSDEPPIMRADDISSAKSVRQIDVGVGLG
ncbi:hypothetical protein J7M28_02610 [bacterium]|nr:hypothetical protein [bacterium]